MAISEIGFDQSRRNLILPFARKHRSGGGQPPRRPTAVATAQPEPPDGGFKITRRAMIAASIVGGSAIAKINELLRP